jgi:DNA-binding response OmpR family regulator
MARVIIGDEPWRRPMQQPAGSMQLPRPLLHAPRQKTTWRILVVESKPKDLECLAGALRRHGHAVDEAGTGEAAIRSFEEADLVLLDLELPDVDGLEVCRVVRSMSDVPLIAVSASGSEIDRVLGLQAGADDYVEKPYGMRELLARIDAVMRRASPKNLAVQVLSHGPLTIDAGSRKVSLGGRIIDVTRKEFDLLYLLASHPGTVIPRKRIMQQIWGDSWSRRTVDTHVSSLRGKLGGSDWIVTVRGVGFRFGEV